MTAAVAQTINQRLREKLWVRFVPKQRKVFKRAWRVECCIEEVTSGFLGGLAWRYPDASIGFSY